jgi:hypothetical protein
MEQGVLFDLEIFREGMFVPSEKNARGDRFDIHGRCFDDASVGELVLEDFFMEFGVLAPAGDGIKAVEMIRERWSVKVAADMRSRVAVLLAGLEVLADHELKKPDSIGGHG